MTSVTKTFTAGDTFTGTLGPLIEGEADVIQGAIYNLKVEILQTHFGKSSEYASIEVYANVYDPVYNRTSYKRHDFGECRPPCAGECCSWHSCNIDSKATLTATDRRMHFRIQFSYAVDTRLRRCKDELPYGGVSARITLVLKG